MLARYKQKILFGGFLLSSTLILLLGYSFEVPYGNRRHLMNFLIIGFLLVAFVQGTIKKKPPQYILTILLITLLIIMEFNSKYAINYFFHSMYILILMYLIFNYEMKAGLFFSVLLLIGASIKFIELLTIQFTFSNVSIFIFFLIIQILILLVAVFAKVYREENQKTKVLYTELLETNRQLKAYSKEIKYLTTIEERTKIARDLHDTLGHDMTGLIMQMEMVSRLFVQNHSEQGMLLLEDSKKSARDSLVKVRQILNTLKSESEPEWTNTSVYELSEEFAKKTHVKIKCIIIGERSVKPDIGITLYRVVQEALTNSVRHGLATQIYVTITYLENVLTFSIVDNGKGATNFTKGNGLNGMCERINNLKGEISFQGNKGFKIEGKLPYHQEAYHD